MTFYNKTTEEKTYGDEKMFKVTLPASQSAGTRGPAVVIDGKKHIAVQKDWERVNADRLAGNIEIVE